MVFVQIISFYFSISIVICLGMIILLHRNTMAHFVATFWYPRAAGTRMATSTIKERVFLKTIYTNLKPTHLYSYLLDLMFCLHLMVWNKRDPTYFVGPYCQEKKRLLLVTCLTQPHGRNTCA